MVLKTHLPFRNYPTSGEVINTNCYINIFMDYTQNDNPLPYNQNLQLKPTEHSSCGQAITPSNDLVRTPAILSCATSSEPLPSIVLNGVTIYQTCIDGLMPQTMLNDSIVSYLIE